MTTPMHTPIHPFRIEVPQTAIDDLHERLTRTRWMENLPDTGWERGVPLTYLQQLADYWHKEFDWRLMEQQLNELPHFMTEVEGQPIHFIHVRSAEPSAKPLMLIHGWPGSFIEFWDVIDKLTNPPAHGGEAAEAFHLVIPSIPGFGYSVPLKQTGWTPSRIAGALLQVMDRLGYECFGVQGGDTGSFIAPEMGQLAPERVLGVHVNALLTFPSGAEGELESLTETEHARLASMESYNDGYLQIQSKSPNTLAYGLEDSPVAQLAWIIEHYKTLTHPAEALPEQIIDLDRLLTNVSLYWFTGSGGSSAQVYYESMNDEAAWLPKERGTVPTGVLVSLACDVTIRSFAERDHNIVHWAESEVGGHFFAMEQPERFVQEVRAFFSKLE